MKIVCYGKECIEGACPQHGGLFIVFEKCTSLRIPHEELDKDLESFYRWMRLSANLIFQDHQYEKQKQKE